MYGDSKSDKWFRDAWAKTGKKLDMGKSCIRFKRVDDLALDVIGEGHPRDAGRQAHRVLRNGLQVACEKKPQAKKKAAAARPTRKRQSQRQDEQ